MWPTFIVINKSEYKLYWYRYRSKNLRFSDPLIFDVGIGTEGYQTKSGIYWVSGRSRTPAWKAPNSDWVSPAKRGLVAPFYLPSESFPGLPVGFIPSNTSIPLPAQDPNGYPIYNPENPYMAGLLDFGGDKDEGYAIHGTKHEETIPGAVSHGCVRMRAVDLSRIYDRTPNGTPVVIF